MEVGTLGNCMISLRPDQALDTIDLAYNSLTKYARNTNVTILAEICFLKFLNKCANCATENLKLGVELAFETSVILRHISDFRLPPRSG